MSSEKYEALGIDINPFPPGACKEHYFQTDATRRILEELIYGIAAHKGFLVLVGEVGLGKNSMLIQLIPLLERENIRSSWIFNTLLNKTELLQAIARDFGIQTSEAANLAELLDTLHRFFLEENKAGNNCAIILDEAHLVDFQAMEVLRMLSNLEFNGEKLVQILLCGQPELRAGLDQPQMRQLRSRINVFHELPPLTRSEVKDYLGYKLSLTEVDFKLDGQALSLLWQASAGNFRLLNLLMEKALYATVARDERRIAMLTVMDALKEVGTWDDTLARRLRRIKLRKVGLWGGIGGAAVLLLLTGVTFWAPWTPSPLSNDAPGHGEVAVSPRPPAPEQTTAQPFKGEEPPAPEQQPVAVQPAPKPEPLPEPEPAAEPTAPPEPSQAESPTPLPDTATRGDEQSPSAPGDALADRTSDDGLNVKKPAPLAPAPEEKAAETPRQASRELRNAATEFLGPWSLENLNIALYQALMDNAPEEFAKNLRQKLEGEETPLRLLTLEALPPKGSVPFTAFPWQLYSDFGPAWIVLWRPPLALEGYDLNFRSPEVITLQKRLDALGYYRMGIDGTVGPGTWKALERFQRDHGLKVTGKPDPVTLFWIYTTNKRARPGQAVKPKPKPATDDKPKEPQVREWDAPAPSEGGKPMSFGLE